MDEALSHINRKGEANMVEVGDKPVSRRFARAGGVLRLTAATLDILTSGKTPKGDVFAAARLAGIAAAKRTAEWIPLCHVLPLESVAVDLAVDADDSLIRCEVRVAATAKTGVEMEALVGVQAALATLYDMLKAADKGMIIDDIRLLEKRGGRSGNYVADV